MHTIAAAVVESGAPRDSAMGSPRAAVTDRGMIALAMSAKPRSAIMSSLGNVSFQAPQVDAPTSVTVTR